MSESKLPQITRWEPPIEDLILMLPDRPAAEVLKGRMTKPRADALCLSLYGRTFAQERKHRREMDNQTKQKNRFWCGIGANRKSSRRNVGDDGGPRTNFLNGR